MKQINIPLGGVVRNTPNGVSADGDMEEVINLRKKNGTYNPVMPPKSLGVTNSFTNIYIHRESWYAHVLGVKDGKLWYFANLTTVVSQITPIEIMAVGTVKSIYQIGNSVCVIDSGMKYAVWYDGAYKAINVDFDGNQGDKYLNVSSTVSLKVDGVTRMEMDPLREELAEYYDLRFYMSDVKLGYTSISVANQSENLKLRKDVAVGLLERARSVENKDGRIDGFFMACTAVELFDGSYILHSNPILLCQALDENARYQAIGGTRGFDYIAKRGLVYDFVRGFSSSISNTDQYSNSFYDRSFRWRENLSSLSYVNLGVCPPNVVAWTKNIAADSNINSKPMWAVMSGNDLKFRVDKTIDPSYKGIIKSISVFITDQVSMYDNNDIQFTGSCLVDTSGGYDSHLENFSGKVKPNAEIVKEIENLKVFYKVHSIPFEEIVDTNTWVSIDLKGKLGDLLYSQEVLPIDPFTHHSISPNGQYIYNSKQHVYDYNMLLSRGFTLFNLQCIAGIGQFQPKVFTPQLFVSSVFLNKTLYELSEGAQVMTNLMMYESNPLDPMPPYMEFQTLPEGFSIYSKPGFLNWYLQYIYPSLGVYYVRLKYKIRVYVASATDCINENTFIIGASSTESGGNTILKNIKTYTYYDLGGAGSFTDIEVDFLLKTNVENLGVDKSNLKGGILYGTSLSGIEGDYVTSYEFLEFEYSILQAEQEYYIETDILTENGLSKVVRTYEGQFDVIDFNQIVSYPDSRATKILIYELSYGNTSSYKVINTYELKAHQSHNFAYCISPDLKPLGGHDTATTGPGYLNIPEEINRSIHKSNTLKVSNVNNPFYFPAENTYQIGEGVIKGLMSNSIALSTGQFGEYPLMVFCSDGIYAMYVGQGLIDYSTVRPVARDVATGAIVAVDGGILFVTSRGLMVISGANVKEISDPIEGTPFGFYYSGNAEYIPMLNNIVANASLCGLTSSISMADFKTVLQTAKIGYNYKEREILVSGSSYTYVYSGGVWRKSSFVPSYYINDYPNQLAVSGANIYDVGNEFGSNTPVLLISRPVKLQSQSFKSARRFILRSKITLDYPNYAGLYLFGSWDNKKWVFVGGTEKNVSRRDIGTLLESRGFKYLRFVFASVLNKESTIDYAEILAMGDIPNKNR